MLLFIVVIFFLIYGVEVYFKVRGGFLENTGAVRIAGGAGSSGSGGAGTSFGAGDCGISGSQEDVPQRHPVNASQLHQSRVGLVSQALMLITISGFLCSETLSEFWKTKVGFFYLFICCLFFLSDRFFTSILYFYFMLCTLLLSFFCFVFFCSCKSSPFFVRFCFYCNDVMRKDSDSFLAITSFK